MEYLWKTDFYVDENALSVNVNRLRKNVREYWYCGFYSNKKMGWDIRYEIIWPLFKRSIVF